MAAEIVTAGRTTAVSSPVPEGTDDLMEQRIIGIDRAAFSHGHVMGRIKTGSSDIAYGSGEFLFSVYLIHGPQGVTVVLDQPQSMAGAEILHCFQIKGISQCMGQHHRLSPGGNGFLQPVRRNIILGDRHIHKDRHCPILNDG